MGTAGSAPGTDCVSDAAAFEAANAICASTVSRATSCSPIRHGSKIPISGMTARFSSTDHGLHS